MQASFKLFGARLSWVNYKSFHIYILDRLIRCKAVVTLQGVDALHLIGSQFEVEDVVVLGDMGSIRGARDSDGATLQMPAENDLIG